MARSARLCPPTMRSRIAPQIRPPIVLDHTPFSTFDCDVASSRAFLLPPHLSLTGMNCNRLSSFTRRPPETCLSPCSSSLSPPFNSLVFLVAQELTCSARPNGTGRDSSTNHGSQPRATASHPPTQLQCSNVFPFSISHQTRAGLREREVSSEQVASSR